jgi:hypothetical protein
MLETDARNCRACRISERVIGPRHGATRNPPGDGQERRQKPAEGAQEAPTEGRGYAEGLLGGSGLIAVQTASLWKWSRGRAAWPGSQGLAFARGKVSPNCSAHKLVRTCRFPAAFTCPWYRRRAYGIINGSCITSRRFALEYVCCRWVTRTKRRTSPADASTTHGGVLNATL